MAGTSPYFNVRDYGAAGNGTTDDTAAIAQAIAAAVPSSALPATLSSSRRANTALRAL